MTATMLAPPSAPPRFRYVPTFHSSLGRDAIDLAEFAGLTLDDWQQDIIEGSLGSTAAGKWSASNVGVVLPRQNGKGGVLEARQLAGLYLVKSDRLQTHTAHRFDTCLDHFGRVCALIENTPDLLAEVLDNGRGIGGRPSGIKDSNGKESITLRNGKQLRFKTRVKGSGRGASGDAVYFDEAYYLLDLGSLVPSLSARVNPQVWFTSSAPLPQVESDRLRKLMRQGRKLAA
jgi:hypothetical protein